MNQETNGRERSGGDRSPEMHSSVEGTESVTVAVVTAVAAAEQVDPLELQPLERVVDTDALDSLWKAGSAADRERRGCLTFTYEGYEVSIVDGETVTVRPEQYVYGDD
jgi:endonuclease YncB( thermonuclease family)